MKAKLALAVVTGLILALTVVVMILVNGSWSFGTDRGETNPENLMFKENSSPEENADPFSSNKDAFPGGAVNGSLPGDEPATSTSTSGSPLTPAPQKPKDDFFKNSPFEE